MSYLLFVVIGKYIIFLYILGSTIQLYTCCWIKLLLKSGDERRRNMHLFCLCSYVVTFTFFFFFSCVFDLLFGGNLLSAWKLPLVFIVRQDNTMSCVCWQHKFSVSVVLECLLILPYVWNVPLLDLWFLVDSFFFFEHFKCYSQKNVHFCDKLATNFIGVPL